MFITFVSTFAQYALTLEYIYIGNVLYAYFDNVNQTWNWYKPNKPNTNRKQHYELFEVILQNIPVCNRFYAPLLIC